MAAVSTTAAACCLAAAATLLLEPGLRHCFRRLDRCQGEGIQQPLQVLLLPCCSSCWPGGAAGPLGRFLVGCKACIAARMAAEPPAAWPGMPPHNSSFLQCMGPSCSALLLSWHAATHQAMTCHVWPAAPPPPKKSPPSSEQPQPFLGLAGDVAIASNGWPEVVVWTPWTAMEACYR